MSLDVRSFIIDINDEQNTKQEESPKERKNWTTYTTIINSGPDIVIERRRTEKQTPDKQLVLIASQKLFYIKDVKAGKVEKLDVESYKKFWSSIVGADTPFRTGNDLFDVFYKKDAFANDFLTMLNKPVFYELAKEKIITVSAYMSNWHLKSSTTFEMYCQNAGVRVEDVPIVRYFAKKYAEMNSVSYAYALSTCLNSRSSEVAFFADINQQYGLDQTRKAIDYYIANDDLKINRYSYRYSYDRKTTLGRLFELARFDFDSFLEYIFSTSVEEGMANTVGDWVEQWQDTVKMEVDIYGKVTEKYPKNLLTKHQILSYKYSKVKQEIDERKWEEAAAKAKTLECDSDDFILIAPEKPADLVDEGIQMSNCVASYTQQMINGECIIMFFRQKNEPSASLCTAEFRLNNNGEYFCVQFKARFNRTPSSKMFAVLQEMTEKINTNLGLKKRTA